MLNEVEAGVEDGWKVEGVRTGFRPAGRNGWLVGYSVDFSPSLSQYRKSIRILASVSSNRELGLMSILASSSLTRPASPCRN